MDRSIDRRIIPKPKATSEGGGSILDASHRAKARASSLTDETIALAGLYTQRDTPRLRMMLRGSFAVAPALILPSFDRFGNRNNWDVARLMPPMVTPKGKVVKYLMPTGLGSRAYFPPFPIVQEAIATPGMPIIITEGILKALASTQAGIPCIGLMGVGNWSKHRTDKDDPRQLIEDLEAIDWIGLSILVVFDTDARRNPNVNRELAELALILSEKGADVRLPRLPIAMVKHGIALKQGIDDFIVRHGAEAFREWVQRSFEDEPVRSLEDWWEDVKQARLFALPMGGVYLDRSPTGAGKSYADSAAINAMGEEHRSLVLVPAHVNCDSVCADLAGQGIDASAFPPLNDKTCLQFKEATEVMRQGLTFQKVLCPKCEHNGSCEYSVGYNTALAAPNSVATHKRGEIMMDKMAEDRDYVSIHENPLAMLRPQLIAVRGFSVVAELAKWAEMLLHTKARKEVGPFYQTMKRIATELHGWAEGANETDVIPLPEASSVVPRNADAHLWETMRDRGFKIIGEAVRIVRAVAAGEVEKLVALVDVRAKGEGVEVHRRILAQMKTALPRHATVLINDATASKSDLERAAGRTISDITPSGRLPLKWPIIQVLRDVTQSTTVDRAASILRGILYDLGPSHKRIGVITHLRLTKSLGGLFSRKENIVVSHFRSGQSRGSNAWIRDVDALVVLGTPRVPPDAIRAHLVRLDDLASAQLSTEGAGWSKDYWSGKTVSGKRVTVQSLAYADHEWHAAHVSLVHAELIQSVGRARPILDQGIPCVVVTTEDLGYPIVDPGTFDPLTEVQAKVLAEMRNERGTPRFRSGPQISESLGFNRQRALAVLNELVSSGRVRKDGRRFRATPRTVLRLRSAI